MWSFIRYEQSKTQFSYTLHSKRHNIELNLVRVLDEDTNIKRKESINNNIYNVRVQYMCQGFTEDQDKEKEKDSQDH